MSEMCFIQVTIGHVCKLPSSFSTAVSEVIATGNRVNALLPRIKLQIFLSLNIIGNIWDNAHTELNKIHNKGF